MQVLELRIADLPDLLAHFAEEAAVKLGRRKTCAAEVKIFSAKAVGAGAFVALRELFARKVPKGRVVEDAVTKILSLRRGTRPVDIFSVCDDQLVDNFFSQNLHDVSMRIGGTLKIHSATNGAAVKLVAPLDVMLRGRRDDHGALLPVKELVVKAHFVALVPDHANPGSPLFRVDTDAFEYPAEDQAAYATALAGALLRKANAVFSGNVPAEFKQWAMAVAKK